MSLLKIYIIGILVCILISILLEHLYFGNGKSETVHIRTILENLAYSLLSWLGVVGEIIFFAGEWVCGFDQRGQGVFLYEYEETLKQEKAKHDAQDGKSDER